MDALVGRWRPLAADTSADVVVIGAGITGATAALLLKQRGRKVVLLDAASPGAGETARSSAHVTVVPDTRFATLAARFGRARATAALQGYAAAIDWIEDVIRALGITCDFVRVPGHLYCDQDEAGERELEREADSASELGIAARLVPTLPLPFPIRRALRFERQAQLHPVRYLAGLLPAVDGEGSMVHGDTRVLDVQDGDPCHVHTEHGTITCRAVIVAAHVPFTNRVLLHTKLSPHRSYVIAAETDLPEDAGLCWDVARPYHYWRTARVEGVPLVLVGGGDHRVGERENAEASFETLERYLAQRLGRRPLRHRWSGQIIEPADGLPYVGRNSLSTRIFVATGYAGNGIAGGTLAAMLLADDVTGVPNPWAEVLAATRVHAVASASAVVRENAAAARHMIVDRLRMLPALAVRDIARGEGRVVQLGGRPLAIYRQPLGNLVAVSAVCTHLGGLVAWNDAERTWDCPCHGSRFGPDGCVLNGPAVAALERRDLADEVSDELVPQTPLIPTTG
jgi:glycine/D-amino acid oxidase-like deaminating enzyme/nitrite reductase/ring-hydroxylating ferredoxin subunit